VKLAYVAWIVICVVWGTVYLGIRVALESVPVALLAGLRWAAAGILLAALVRLWGGRIPPIRTWPSIALTGFLMIVIGNGAIVWAQQHVDSGLTAVILATVPFWSVLVEASLGSGERLTRRAAAGLALGFVGIVVLVWPQLTLRGQEGEMFLYGLLALQLACAGWALGTSYTKRNARLTSQPGAVAMQMLLSGVMLIAIGTVAGEWQRLSLTSRAAGALIYLVLVGSIVGYSAYVYALKYLAIATVSLYAYVTPIIAVVLGSVLLDEPFGVRTVAAAALVLTGSAITHSDDDLMSRRVNEQQEAKPEGGEQAGETRAVVECFGDHRFRRHREQRPGAKRLQPGWPRRAQGTEPDITGRDGERGADRDRAPEQKDVTVTAAGSPHARRAR
jgi:drug/metabolite transporter (DMT)-like permease